MAKRSREQIRKDEKKVIELLEKDARQSPNEIARQLGFSRQKAWRIIKRLEKTEEIWGYTTIIDTGKADLKNLYVVIIESKSPTVKYTKKLIKRLKNKNAYSEMDIKIYDLFFLHGNYNWLMIFSANDIRHAIRFTGYLEKNYSDLISEIHLLETIFPLLKAGKSNPNIENIEEYAIKK